MVIVGRFEVLVMVLVAFGEQKGILVTYTRSIIVDAIRQVWR